MQCLVLAGGTPRPGEPLFDQTSGRPKALLDLGGRPMVQRVLDALAASREIDAVVLVGGPDQAGLDFPGTLDRVSPGGTLARNLFRGIDRLQAIDPGARRAAFCWSDIPLATGSMIDRFVETANATAPDADVVAGLVAREVLLARWPEVEERWLRVREGSFVAADFGVFDPRRAEAVRRPLEILTGQRKSALRQAGTVGFGLLLRYLLGRLTLAGLERALARRYRIDARVIVAADPELGLDVDGPVNLAICRRELAARGDDAGPARSRQVTGPDGGPR